MSNFLTDVRYALRAMAKRPGNSALLVATLAVGLAANGVVFNFLDAMVLRPFPFPNVCGRRSAPSTRRCRPSTCSPCARRSA